MWVVGGKGCLDLSCCKSNDLDVLRHAIDHLHVCVHAHARSSHTCTPCARSPLAHGHPNPLNHPTPSSPHHRRRGIFDTDFLALLAHVLLGTILSKLVPFLYGARPALLQLGAGLPYSKILKAVKRDAAAAAVLLAALGVWVGSRIAAKLATGGAA